jgi:hypothetical protein
MTSPYKYGLSVGVILINIFYYRNVIIHYKKINPYESYSPILNRIENQNKWLNYKEI